MSIPPAQDNQLEVGALLSSGCSTYQVESLLGQGSFGTVVKCIRMCDKKTVAIKMMKNEGHLIEQAKEEVLNLKKLRSLDPDRCNIVRWHQSFVDRGHSCLVFEQLDRSLHDFLVERQCQPLPLAEIRLIVHQLANALDHLSAVGIIHADLKLENVMLVNHRRRPYRVKLIDFGLACDVSAARLGSYIQSRFYRAPEILLGLPFTEAIDMWSLGCLAAVLYLGYILYPGKNEYDMMRYIVETQGQPPDHLLTLGSKTGRFFNRDCKTTLWTLKTAEQYQSEKGIQLCETRRMKFSSLNDLLNVHQLSQRIYSDVAAEIMDRLMFVTMLRGMLKLDPLERLTPRQVLEHPFISRSHMACLYPLSSYAHSCSDMMKVCQKTLASDNGEDVQESVQDSTSRTAHPVPQNLPPPPPPPSPQRHRLSVIKTNPCFGTLNTRAGIKRELNHEDGTTDEISRQSKRVKLTLDRGHHTSPIPTSSSHHQTDSVQASTAMRTHLTPPSDHNLSTTSSKQHPDRRGISRVGMKRKISDVEDEGPGANSEPKTKTSCQRLVERETHDVSRRVREKKTKQLHFQ